jgi:predicted permease
VFLIVSVRRAVRQLGASRVFSTAVVLTLALGIGATTAIFTLIDRVMLRPLPVSDPARLYRIGDGDDTIASGRHGRWGFFPFPLYERLAAGAPEFLDVTAFGLGNPVSARRQGGAGAARPLRPEYATGSYFSTLGVGPSLGRVFSADDDRASAAPVAVLSHHAWEALYAGDPTLVGATFVIQGQPFTVVGVAAAGFFGETVQADPPEIWIPLQHEPLVAGAGSLLRQPTSSWLAAIGRLRPDRSTAAVSPRLTAILRQWLQYEAQYPTGWLPDITRDLPKQVIAVVPAGAGIGFGGLSIKEQYGPTLRILLAICGLVLLTACANAANLLLARAAARRTQTAVRVAIGATRRQIAAEALVESVLLAAAGGLAGLFVAVGAARLLVILAFRNAQFVPITTRPSLDVLAFAAGLSLVTGVAFGVAPAWFGARTDPIDALRGGGPTTSDRAWRTRAAPLAIQAALSVVLIACATMLARSLGSLRHQDFGFPPEGRLAIGLNRLPPVYTPQQLAAVYRDVEERLARLPGVRGVGLALYNPLTSNWSETVLVAGQTPRAGDLAIASWDRVSAGYLQSLGVGLVRGRLFTSADNQTTAPVAVVNEAFVKRFLGEGDDPLDRRFGAESPDNAGTFRIVGVVHDAKFAASGLNRPARPMFFVPLAQRVAYKSQSLNAIETLSHDVQGIVLATDGAPRALEALVPKALTAADPNLTIRSVRTMREQIDRSFDRERAMSSLAELFAIVALALAAVGIYGVSAYVAVSHTREIGIRIALGADAASVIRLILGRVFPAVAAGAIVGVMVAVGAGHAIAAQLYGVSSWDPPALAVGGGSIAACAAVAALIPAVRAAALPPMNALRVIPR